MKQCPIPSKGFVISEVMIVFGVLFILALIAFPAYRDYNRRTYFNEVVQAANSLKEAVTYCFADLKMLKNCSSGLHHIPAAITTPKGAVASLIVKEGVITAIPVAWDGIEAKDTYILTPKIQQRKLIWVISGGSVDHGLAS